MIQRYTKDQLKAKYAKLKPAFLRQNPRCQRCGKAAQDVHHKFGRLGILVIIVELFIPVCRLCHIWIDANREAARQADLLAPYGQYNSIPKELRAKYA